MSLDIRPIFSALLRNRTGAVLVALQVAIALAVLTNAVYIVDQRVTMIDRPTGIDDANMFVIDSTGFGGRFDYNASLRNDLDYLRGLSGVVDASPINHAPLSGGGSSTSIQLQPNIRNSSDTHPLNYFEMDEHELN